MLMFQHFFQHSRRFLASILICAAASYSTTLIRKLDTHLDSWNVSEGSVNFPFSGSISMRSECRMSVLILQFSRPWKISESSVVFFRRKNQDVRGRSCCTFGQPQKQRRIYTKEWSIMQSIVSCNRGSTSFCEWRPRIGCALQFLLSFSAPESYMNFRNRIIGIRKNTILSCFEHMRKILNFAQVGIAYWSSVMNLR
jgi:hypothetical protein